VIEIRGLKKHFKKLQVLRGIDFSIREGEILALIGPSGSGKSTLLRCINGIEGASEGSVEIDGVDIVHHRHGARIDEIRAGIGFVFQSFNLFPHMSVQQNITLAPMLVKKKSREEADAEAEALLRRVGLLDKIAAYPRQLSGGQCQRVAIARALAMNPKYMLFDEPTSALDPEMIGEVLAVIRDVAASGMTMVIVTHEMNFAREIASSVVFMDGGLLLEKAPPDRFFASPQNPRAAEFISKML
jgi:ABC-type polar amino acid transport system ATPase subunit